MRDYESRDLAGAAHLAREADAYDDDRCPTCDGGGEVSEALTPGVDHRDPAFETREWPCPTCVEEAAA